MNRRGYKVIARIDNNEELERYTSAKDPYDAIESCLEEMRKELPSKGRLTFEYFPIKDEDITRILLKQYS